MASEIYLVKVGMTMTEGMVEEWYVPDGGRVEKGQLLYRLETEKVNLDVDADASGIVRHGVAVGVMMKPGDVIGLIYAPGEAIPAPGGAAAAPRVAPAPVTVSAATVTTAAPAGERSMSSPAARRLARELNVDIGAVTGTGPGGRITNEDVERAAKSVAAAASTVAPTAVAPPGTTIPLKGIRKTIATRMFDSLHGSAQLTMDMDAAMDDAVKLREQLIAEWHAEAIRPAYTDLVVKAVAKALRAHPLMNSVFGPNEITLCTEIHVGVAVAIDAGLVVPVIRDADTLSLKTIAATAARLATAARAGTLGLDDMAAGTFTVTALGMYGVDSFTPILNAPQSGILGVNRIRDEVVWQSDRAVPRKCMRLSLTWDHRVLDGAPAAQFLGSVRELLEAPYRLLVD
jgi:pyruvate dehydrogenase E2 component (dihydrolipoamide acetyltransferase)